MPWGHTSPLRAYKSLEGIQVPVEVWASVEGSSLGRFFGVWASVERSILGRFLGVWDPADGVFVLLFYLQNNGKQYF